MNRDEVYARWAPEGAPWSPWVKPVLFAHVSDGEGEEPPRPRISLPSLLPPDELGGDPYRAPARGIGDVAVIVDLPGPSSVGAGLVLASFGFQPVPLYNALPGPPEGVQQAVEVRPLIGALVAGAHSLGPPHAGAPPAFLLDARRLTMQERLQHGWFDNRSFCNWSDFPTADRLRQAGVRRVVLLGGALRWDVAAILLRWHKAGLALFSTVGERPQPLGISWWTRVRHWFERQAFDSGGPSTG